MRRTHSIPAIMAVRCLIDKSKVLLLIGRTNDALNAAQEALIAAACCDDRRVTADCLMQLNFIYYSTARFQDMARCSKRCLSLCQKIGYTAGIADSHAYIAHSLDNEGKLIQANENYKKSAELWRADGNLEEYAICFENIGMNNDVIGDYKTADIYYREAMDVAKRIKSTFRLLKLEQTIASRHLLHGEYRTALDGFLNVLKAYDRIGDRCNSAMTMHQVGYIHFALGNDDEAFRCLIKSERIKEEIDDRWAQVCSLNLLARFSAERCELDQAARHLEKGDRIASDIGSIDLFCRLAVARGMLSLACGDNAQATLATNRAMELADQAILMTGKAEATLLRARINMARGNHEDAEPLFRKALGLFQEQQSVLDQGIVQYYHGLNKTGINQNAEARALLTNASEIFRRIGAAAWLARAEQALAGIAA